MRKVLWTINDYLFYLFSLELAFNLFAICRIDECFFIFLIFLILSINLGNLSFILFGYQKLFFSLYLYHELVAIDNNCYVPNLISKAFVSPPLTMLRPNLRCPSYILSPLHCHKTVGQPGCR